MKESGGEPISKYVSMDGVVGFNEQAKLEGVLKRATAAGAPKGFGGLGSSAPPSPPKTGYVKQRVHNRIHSRIGLVLHIDKYTND